MRSNWRRFGGIASILLGVAYVVAAVMYALLPPEQRSGDDAAKFFFSLHNNPLPLTMVWLALALTGILGIAVVPALTAFVGEADQPVLRWASTLAIVGFAVTAIENFRFERIQPARAAQYICNCTDEAAKKTIATIALAPLDPGSWLSFGAVGLWLLLISLAAWRSGRLPRLLALLGVVGALVYLSLVAANLLNLDQFATVATIVGGAILAPIFYIWLGIVLSRASAREPNAASTT